MEAIEGQDTLQFADFAGKGDTFALQVSGESMIDDHIMSGDYVLVERAQQAQDGEIVVALVDGREATLKRLYHEPDGRIRLQPANASMQPIIRGCSLRADPGARARGPAEVQVTSSVTAYIHLHSSSGRTRGPPAELHVKLGSTWVVR